MTPQELFEKYADYPNSKDGMGYKYLTQQQFTKALTEALCCGQVQPVVRCAKWVYNDVPRQTGLYLVNEFEKEKYLHYHYDAKKGKWAGGTSSPKGSYRFLDVPINPETLNKLPYEIA